MPPRFPPTPEASVELAPQPTKDFAQHDCLDLGPAALSPSSPKSLDIPLDEKQLAGSAFSSHTLCNGVVDAQTTLTRSKRIRAMKPPPPRRNPIIHMQPQAQTADSHNENTVTKGRRKAVGKNKKNATTLDERQRARKSTHSEIERRRRLKINSQFELLKQLVPACQNQDMHKLTILEATTEYIQYLLDSIKEVKGNDFPSVVATPSLSAESLPMEDCKEQDVECSETEESDMDEDVPLESAPLTGISMSTAPSPFLLASNMSDDFGYASPRSVDHDATEALLLLHDQAQRSYSIKPLLGKPLTVREMLS